MSGRSLQGFLQEQLQFSYERPGIFTWFGLTGQPGEKHCLLQEPSGQEPALPDAVFGHASKSAVREWQNGR